MLSTETLYLLYLTTGFTVGFGHCIGMCGPIVVTFSLNLRKKSILAPQLLYHLGRITTYTLLGGVVAAVGSFTIVAASIESFQKGVMIFSGALIMLMGLAMLDGCLLVKFLVIIPTQAGGYQKVLANC